MGLRSAKRFSRLLLGWLIFIAATCTAQGADGVADEPPAVRGPHWVFGVLAGGGSGLSEDTDVQYVRAGVRVGRVLMREHGPGFVRGTLEWDLEFTPVDYVLWSDYRNVYGIGVTPVIVKWNFTGCSKVAPYILGQAGVLWSAHDVPPGDTSRFNFITGAGVGMNYFVRPGRSWNIDLRSTHLSNASLGNQNPGVNASLQLSIGYNWWKQ